jgi:hypothetical protein
MQKLSTAYPQVYAQPQVSVYYGSQQILDHFAVILMHYACHFLVFVYNVTHDNKQ